MSDLRVATERAPVVGLSHEVFRALKRTLTETVGSEKADEVLFRLGRQWGELDARRTEPGSRDPEAWLRDGLVAMRGHGLADVAFDAVEQDRGADTRIVGRVLDSFELRAAEETGRAAEGPLCNMTAGYLTGFSSVVTGADTICTPLDCAEGCSRSPERLGCRFEILAAHRWNDAANGHETDEHETNGHQTGRHGANGHGAPSGSARFFLRSLGRKLTDADLSLDDLLENTTDAILLIDADGVVRFWNRGAERMFLHSRDEAIGRDVSFLMPPDLVAADELGELRRRTAAEGAVSSFVTRRVRKDGSELVVSLNRTVLRDSAGIAIGTTAVIRDLSSVRAIEEELGRVRELAVVGELAAKIAHEVKNPLAGIYGAIQLLRRGFDEEDERHGVLAEVERTIHRLDDTVLDLLRFARPVPPKLLGVGLGSMIRENVAALELHEEVQKQRVEVDVDEGLVLRLDVMRMSQVFTNLILNAAQAMPQGGTLRIRGRAEASRVVIEVCDEGPGIPQELAATVFDPFFTTKARGTGLGLAIAKKNVESHGGTIAVANTPGGGARFRIVLPLDRREGRSEGPSDMEYGA